MDLSSLLELGKKLLLTPKFQKLLGDINLAELSQELANLRSKQKDLESKLSESPSGIGVEPNKKGLDVLKKETLEKIKFKVEQIKQKTIPRFEEYTVTGRIYDSQTAEPLKGVRIQVGVDLKGGDDSKEGLPIKTPKELSSLNTNIKLATDFKPYTPINSLLPKGVKPKTDSNGYFSFTFKTLAIGVEDTNNEGEKRELTSLLDVGLIFMKKGYLPSSTSLLTLSNSVKRDLPTKGMFNINQAAQNAKDEVNNTIYAVGTKISQIGLSPFEKIIVGRKKSIQNVTNLLTQKLIPLIIEILLMFSIAKPSQAEQVVCPSPERLKEALSKRNRAIKQINQVFTSIIINTGLAAVFLILSNALRTIRLNIDSLPFPMAFGTPPAKDWGGLAGAIPYSVIGTLQRIDDLLEELEDQNEGLNKQTLISLAFLIAGLIFCRLMIKTVDDSFKKCAQEKIDSGEFTLEELREELQNLAEENEVEGIIKKPFVNGFDLSVIETDNEIGKLIPRQAIAKNKDGIIQLKGEPSFSSTDQVLIDELAFYIKSNNLKAF
jgi:hypothetical protein